MKNRENLICRAAHNKPQTIRKLETITQIIALMRQIIFWLEQNRTMPNGYLVHNLFFNDNDSSDDEEVSLSLASPPCRSFEWIPRAFR
jgi:hypothetical protein